MHRIPHRDRLPKLPAKRRAEPASELAPHTLVVAPPELSGAFAEALGEPEEGLVSFRDPRLALYFVSARPQRLRSVAVDAAVPELLARGLVAALERLRPGLRAYRARRHDGAHGSGSADGPAVELVPLSPAAAEARDAPAAPPSPPRPQPEPLRARATPRAPRPEAREGPAPRRLR